MANKRQKENCELLLNNLKLLFFHRVAKGELKLAAIVLAVEQEREKGRSKHMRWHAALKLFYAATAHFSTASGL